MKPSRPDPGAAEPDEGGEDARVVQRAIGNLRDRIRVQDDEIDTLRAMIRVVQNHGAGEQPALVLERIETLEAEIRQTLAETRNARSELLARVESLEAEVMDQARILREMRDVSLRTDANLERLLTELDRLVTEVARRPEAPPVADAATPPAALPLPEIAPPMFDADSGETRFRWRVPAMLLVVLVVLFLAAWGISVLVKSPGRTGATADSSGSLSPIEQGRVYESQKNYAKAEAIYKEVLKKDPNNNEAIRHLASVLFRQDKWEESAAEVKKLTGPDSSRP